MHTYRPTTTERAQAPANRLRRGLGFLLLLGFLLFVVACPSDSPTAPQQGPQPGTGGGGSTVWRVTVSASPQQLSVGGTESSTIRVTVRRIDNNQPPPDGATVVVTTSLGDFNSLLSGLQSGTLSLVGGAAQVLLFPGSNPGTAVIQAQIEGSLGSTNVSFAGTATFFLSAVTPSTGLADGGDTLTITGGGFQEPLRVTIGLVVAPVLSSTSTSIRASTPSITLAQGTTSRVSVSVTTGLGSTAEQTDTLAGAFTYTNEFIPIEVFSASPSSGPNEGGTQLVIAGQGFQSPVQVLFGQGTSTSFSGIEAIVDSASSTEIVVRAPAATGFGQDNRDSEVAILVRNRDSGTSAVLSSAFRYGVNILITAVAPTIGPMDGGQMVTIFGQGFDEPVAVSVVGDVSVAQQEISVTGTEILFRTSPITVSDCEDFTGEILVVNVETGAGTENGPLYTYEVDDTAPQITAVSPTTVSADGGTPVTVTGSNFIEPLRLTLDGAIQAITSVAFNTITFSSPFLDRDDLDEEDCDDNGDGTQGMRFVDTVIEHELAVSLLNTGCEDSISAQFVYQPLDRSCRGDTVIPTASFTSLVSGTVATFTDTSRGGPTTFQWNFGDGGSSSIQNPTHDYGASGTFTATLTVSNSAGSSTASAIVTIP